MKTLILAGYFLAQCVDKDNGKFNVLFEQVNSGRNKAHNMIAHWTEKPIFKRGVIYELKIEAECEQGSQVVEQPNNSQWAPEDSWVSIGKSYICNAIKVTYVSETNLSPCDAYSRWCSVCKD